MSQISKTVTRSLKKAQDEYPYFSRGFQALTFIESDQVPTMGVDRYWRVYYNPKFCEENTITLYNVIRHELEHLLREHEVRVQQRDYGGWNIACDAEINDEIDLLPLGCIRPRTLDAPDHKTAEYYYNNVPSEQNQSAGGEGSGVTGRRESWELDADDGKTPSVSEVDADIIRDTIADDIKSYASKNPGTVPEGVVIWAEARAKGHMPKIRWQNIVAKQIREVVSGRVDYSYSRISRRQNSGDRVLLPSSVAGLPSCALVVDTSGSMANQADWIAGCTRDVLRMFRNNVMLIDCDADVHQSRRLKHWRQITSSIGGGGTDMRKGIDYAIDKLRSDIVIVLTDGYTPWPDKMPKNVIPVVCADEPCI